MDCACGNPGHPWRRALEALRAQNSAKFIGSGRELLKIMQDALEELRYPKPKRTYKLGQWFRNEKDLHVLVRTSNPKWLTFTSVKDGNIWSKPKEVIDNRKVTEEELARIIGSDSVMDYGEFVPVDVNITVFPEADKEKK